MSHIFPRLALFILWLGVSFAARAQPPDDIQPGLYMERISDCMACHTQPEGTPFAGGREIGTPFGTLSSPNITPDPDTGIGKWSDDDFYRALHDGIGHNGEYLYPVMPYTSYTRMTRADVLSIKHYLDSLKPVFAPRAPGGMRFPFDIRATLFVWRELYFQPGTFEPTATHDAEWNRGAYLVQGPGHCGECHSPRNLLGGTERTDSLAGGVVQQWLAPNISSDRLAGLGTRSIAEIASFLRTGATKSMGVAFGPMAEVVHDSMRYATEADLHAIATYLKAGPDRPQPLPASVATPVQLREGQHVYLANCAECHQDNGRGISGFVANLAGNAAIKAGQPNDVIVALLQGLQGTGGYGRMPSFAGALNDAQIAAVTNYLRVAWHDKAPANATPAMVATLRASTNVGAAGTEAARSFDCPAVGSSVISDALATPGQANFLATDDGAFLNTRIIEMVTSLRQQQPQASDATLANTMNAAFCPAVANMSNLPAEAKRTLLLRLSALVQTQISATRTPANDRIVVAAPVAAGVAQSLYRAAAADHEAPDAYLAGLISRQVTGAR
jgi:mono/diheme cytochrome c family protein